MTQADYIIKVTKFMRLFNKHCNKIAFVCSLLSSASLAGAQSVVKDSDLLSQDPIVSITACYTTLSERYEARPNIASSSFEEISKFKNGFREHDSYCDNKLTILTMARESGSITIDQDAAIKMQKDLRKIELGTLHNKVEIYLEKASQVFPELQERKPCQSLLTGDDDFKECVESQLQEDANSYYQDILKHNPELENDKTKCFDDVDKLRPTTKSRKEIEAAVIQMYEISKICSAFYSSNGGDIPKIGLYRMPVNDSRRSAGIYLGKYTSRNERKLARTRSDELSSLALFYSNRLNYQARRRIDRRKYEKLKTRFVGP